MSNYSTPNNFILKEYKFMSSFTAQIRLYGANLQRGEHTRETCPACGGGSTEEKSLSITLSEDGALMWYCFRASCDGVKGTTGNVTGSASRARPVERHVFEGTTRALNDKELAAIERKWGVHNPEHWYWTDEYGGRLAFSVRSPKYTHRGWVLRDMSGNARSKTLNYLDGEESLSWYRKQNGTGGTILVEDIPSAVRASRYLSTVALLGTNCGLAKASEIAQYGTRPIVVALDQDATDKAFELAARWGLLWDDIQVMPLERDIKDLEEGELCQLLTK